MTREDILNYQPEIKPVPAFGTTCHVREMSGPDTITLQAWEKDGDKTGVDTMVQWIIRSVCDQAGTLVFTQDDAEALRIKPTRELRKLFDASLKINGVNDEDVEAAEGESDATANSTPA